MLKLYFRTLRAPNTKTLEEIAQEAIEYYRSHTNKIRETKQRSFRYSLYVTAFESQTILTNLEGIPNSMTYLHAILYSCTVPLYIAREPYPANKARIAVSSFFNSVSWSKYIKQMLRNFGVHYKYHSPIISLLLSYYQVMSIKISHGMNGFAYLDTAFKTVVVALIHLLSKQLSKSIYLKCRCFIPEKVITAIIAYYTAPFIQKFTRFGLIETLKWIGDNLLQILVKFGKKEEPIPEFANIPDMFVCPICRGMLSKPVEINGFFFCSDCLNSWLNRGNSSHPYTGEAISREMISESFLMKTLIRRYRSLYNLEHPEEIENDNNNNNHLVHENNTSI